MPILFKTGITDSTLHGRGIIALEDIPKGATWWVCDDSIPGVPIQNWKATQNITFNKDNFQTYAKGRSHEEMIEMLDYTMNYQDGDQMIYCGDGSGVLNHSEDFNSKIVYNEEKDYKKLRSVATKDIKAGEEITESYCYYPKMRQSWIVQVFRKYVPSRLDFEVNFKIEKKIE